jgi:acetone carboxylase gamma subunit
MSNGKPGLSENVLKDLIEGRLDSETIKEIQRKPKDADRFEKMLEIEQARVTWKERILVPLQEHLYVVQKGKERVVKCSCGYEFGDYKKNWKLGALVYERDPGDGEVYRGPRAADSEWMVLREFYCPGCGTQLEVEAVPHGHPIVFSALPDIDGFYEQRPELRKKVFGED